MLLGTHLQQVIDCLCRQRDLAILSLMLSLEEMGKSSSFAFCKFGKTFSQQLNKIRKIIQSS